MKTKKLKYTPDYNFDLIGIASTEDDYKLSWAIAKTLNIELIRSEDLIIIEEKLPQHQTFSVYENQENAENCLIKLVSNKGNIGFLIEELKNIDYFLIIYESEKTDFADQISTQLKSTKNISAVFKLKPESLKSKEKLLF
jgi:hypothetical protein